MKEVLEVPASFERFCYHNWALKGKWRDGMNKFICIYCGETI